jgi:S1-C subfamily serine protease
MSRVDCHAHTLFLTLIPTLLLATAVQAQPPQAAAAVNCYDEAREMVTRTRPESCQGRQVSDDEAAAIRDRRHSYIKGSLEASQNPIILGKRLMSVGAGFFVNPEGTLLTNAHVVKDCATLIVSRAGGEMYPARLIATEPGVDLALIGTSFHPERSAVFAAADAPLPADVSIIGYPNQGLPPIRPLLTPGTIAPSPIETATPTPRPIAIKADVRPGNSGGPALDESGRVVGVVFAAVDTPAVFKNTGKVVRDVGVAIPNSLSLSFLARNGITPTMAEATAKTDHLLDNASLFVARVECWR